MERVFILNRVHALARTNWDVFAVRLREDITEKEDEFSIHLMRHLAQEVILKQDLPEELSSLVCEYLRPFELSEKTKKIGIQVKFVVGLEKKFQKKERFPEEIMRDCAICFDLIKKLQWKPILIIDCIEKLSNSSKGFLVDFLQRHGQESVTVLSGPNESKLSGFVHTQGIDKYLQTAFIINDDEDELERKTDRESTLEVPANAFELGSFIVNAFATESNKFNYLKLDVWDQLGRSCLVSDDLDFDLCFLGHLRMREDYPRLLRTDYDCTVAIKVLEDAITDISTVNAFAEGAYRILVDGISTSTGVRFEPWDSFIFLATPQVSEVILETYQHLPYRNVFILLHDGTFHNLSPHKWMDHILSNISRKWSAMRAHQGKT